LRHGSALRQLLELHHIQLLGPAEEFTLGKVMPEEWDMLVILERETRVIHLIIRVK
jgi:hypothetical protein